MGLPQWNSLIPDGHPATPEHVRSCPECRGQLESERRYLAALREADIPRASSALQERLLEQTRHLAAQAQLAEERAVRGRGGVMLRAGLSAIAGAAAAAAALSVTAYAVAGDPPRTGAGGESAALIRTASGSGAPAPEPQGQTDGPVISAAFLQEQPVDRVCRGLRMVFGASGRP